MFDICTDDLAENAIYRELQDRGVEASVARQAAEALHTRGMTARTVQRGFVYLGPDRDVLIDILDGLGVVFR